MSSFLCSFHPVVPCAGGPGHTDCWSRPFPERPAGLTCAARPEPPPSGTASPPLQTSHLHPLKGRLRTCPLCHSFPLSGFLRLLREGRSRAWSFLVQAQNLLPWAPSLSQAGWQGGSRGQPAAVRESFPQQKVPCSAGPPHPTLPAPTHPLRHSEHIFEMIYCSLLNTHVARRGQVQPGSLLPGAAFPGSRRRRGQDQLILPCVE